MPQEPSTNNKPEKPWWLEVLPTAMSAASWIIAPMALAVVLGSWLDARYQTTSRYMLISLGAAFVLTLLGLGSELRRFQKQQNQPKSHDTERKQS